ncbi:MAG: hypothetical protein II854_05300, partial [Prevotella sp.]|nr:hypothetical protein [Prevotella sp.]
SKNSFLAAHSPVPGESECKGTAFPGTCKLFGRLFCRNHALFAFLDMNQRHRRHDGGGSTLLYYIGLEGKEWGTTAGQDRAGSAVYGTRGRGRKDRRTRARRKTGRKTEGQKNRKKINGTEDRRTEEQRTEEQKKRKRERKTEGQKNKNRWKGEQEQGGARTGKSP